MARRQKIRSRLNQHLKYISENKERYLAPLRRRNAHQNNSNDYRIIRTINPDSDEETSVVLSEYKGFLSVGVKPYGANRFESQVYFSPLPEFGYDESLKIYLLVYDKCEFKGRPVKAAAADVVFVKGFDIFNKYYLLNRNAFLEYEQFIFNGVAELSTMDEYCFPGGDKEPNIRKIRWGFKSINDKYRRTKAGMRRNLFVLEEKKPDAPISIPGLENSQPPEGP